MNFSVGFILNPSKARKFSKSPYKGRNGIFLIFLLPCSGNANDKIYANAIVMQSNALIGAKLHVMK